MVVVLMAVAVYAVVSRALYDDIDNQLHSRARLLIESGSLAADPGKAIEGTAYSDVNAMLVNPGPVHLHRQPGGADAAARGAGEGCGVRRAADVAAHRQPSAGARRAPGQRQLAADLQEPGPDRPGAQTAGHRAAHRRRARCGGGRDRRWCGRPRGAAAGGPTDRGRRTGGPHRRSAAHPGLRQRRTRPAHRGVQHDAARAGRIAGAAGAAGHRRRPRTAHPADVAAHQRRTADGVRWRPVRRGCPTRRWSGCAPT